MDRFVVPPRDDAKRRQECSLRLGMPKPVQVGRAGPADMGEGRLPSAVGP